MNTTTVVIANTSTGDGNEMVFFNPKSKKTSYVISAQHGMCSDVNEGIKIIIKRGIPHVMTRFSVPTNKLDEEIPKTDILTSFKNKNYKIIASHTSSDRTNINSFIKR